jgi:excisionase family DNA binding protein
MVVVVDPGWWAAQPRELADTLGHGSATGSDAGAGAGAASGAITTGGDRLTVEEAAAALGISRASGYEAARRGEIPCIRIGRRILVPRIALDRLLAAALPDPTDGDDA